jgi:mannan endo-1,4-beta-mannosidase
MGMVLATPGPAQAFPPSDRDAVLRYLASSPSIVAGQHNKEPATEPSRYTAYVHDVTGAYPGLWGGELMFTEADVANRQRVIDQAKTEWANGSLVTLTWHVCPPTMGSSCPFDGGVKSEIGDDEFADILTEGTALHDAWLARLDEVVPYLRQLADAGVPVLFRPLHEMNEDWNWWGSRHADSARLYRLTHDHLAGTRGLANLIWVWNVQDNPAGDWASYYPGDSYVDVLSLDVWWKEQPSQGDYDQLRGISGDKPIAIGEIGAMPSAATLADQPEWRWFLMWSEHVLARPPDELRAAYAHPRVLTQGEIALG